MTAIPLKDHGVVKIASAAMMDKLVDEAARRAPWMLPVFRRCRAGTLAHICVTRGHRIPFDYLSGARPVLAVIGDDDFFSSGPSGWVQRDIRLTLKWAGAAFVFAGAGVAEAYETAAVYAEATGRALVIETDAGHVAEWLEALRISRTPLAGLAVPAPSARPETRH